MAHEGTIFPLSRVRYIYIGLEVLPWPLCLLSTIICTFFTSTPTTVGLTFFWLGALFLPIIACACLLAYQQSDWPKFYTGITDLERITLNVIRTVHCSTNLSVASTWLGIKTLKGLALILGPFNHEDKLQNVEEGLRWFLVGLFLFLILGLWCFLQCWSWEVTVGCIRKFLNAQMENRVDQEGQDVGLVGE
ncbi:hypothetical protein EG329_011580 [Mollisiaceae sp. DMI_Dod_QoI]|nr:hypothetical protein EG329_011580 [Helotiales sp. DMI_Dod_QoI]